ncbi:MAG TPA: DpnD/PcfM family protein [Paludibacteraceae bacterium]|nr:DpnD/PcfM family protein [Paludibacteraceae bacterium]HQB69052.1 DpnD/PcfM family protein [Paludibacteraceae bacterium]HRS68141.1 DpnD/PcfM family protein [Paludibacteraceae bacterium]
MANKLYKIEIIETLCRVIKLKATSFEDALTEVKHRYKTCQIVLDSNDFAFVSFQEINKQSIEDEKNKLALEIIDYLYEDEKKHFDESIAIAKNNHVFSKLEKLKNIIENCN